MTSPALSDCSRFLLSPANVGGRALESAGEAVGESYLSVLARICAPPPRGVRSRAPVRAGRRPPAPATPPLPSAFSTAWAAVVRGTAVFRAADPQRLAGVAPKRRHVPAVSLSRARQSVWIQGCLSQRGSLEGVLWVP